MKKVLIAIAVFFAVVGMLTLPADAVYRVGTSAGSSLTVGGDGGSANQVDLAGDVVASYTSVLGNDTAYKSTMGGNATAVVSAVFGDTAQSAGAASSITPPGGIVNYTLVVTNFANQTDTIRIKTDTPSVSGGSKDSMTIRANGSIIYQNGSDSFLPVAISLAPGASANVTIQFTHDTVGSLGLTSALIKTVTKNGVGGDPGGYLGNNGDSYAGDGDVSVNFSVSVNEINVRMSVEYGNTNTPGSYAGPTLDTIPGATLQCVIRYDNDGNDTAVGYTVAVKIPANSVLADTGIDFSSAHTGAVLSSTITDSVGGVVAYNSVNAERIKWTFSTGVAPNNGDSAGVVDAVSADYDAGILKFKVYIK